APLALSRPPAARAPTLFPYTTLFRSNGDALKLRVADDDGIVVAGGDPGAELLAVLRFKILFRGGENIGGRIQPQELRRPLLGQRSEEHTSELQSRFDLVCRLLLEKNK